MALYTCQNVMDATKRLIEEAADQHVITTEQLIQFVSDAQIQVASESQCLQDTTTMDLTTDTISYTAPTGTESIIDIFYKFPTGYDSLMLIEPGRIPASGDKNYPYYYTYRASKIWIFPELTSLPTESTVEVLFAKIPTSISTAGASLTIPDGYQVIVPYKVAMLVALKDNQLEKASIFDNIIKSFYSGGITAISKYSSSMPAGGNQGTSS